jgi:hypothetical protein
LSKLFNGINEMTLKFSQREVENELRDCFPNGEIRAVSIESGIRESYLDRGINPNDDHVSFSYRYLQVQTALDETNPEMGERHWQAMHRFRVLSLPKGSQAVDIHQEVAKSDKETSELTGAVLTNESLDKQLKEALEARDAHERVIQAILGKMGNGNGSVRSITAPLVEEYRRRNGGNGK